MDIARQRLARSFLLGSSFIHARDVVESLGAVQAQDYLGALWALGQRMSRAGLAAVEREVNEGSIIRTHVLRPTWHFVHPRDLRWMLTLTGPRVRKVMASYDRKLGLTDALYRRSHAAVTRALRDGAFLTRAELKEVLLKAKIGELGVQRAAHLLMRAELDQVVCSGPRRGKQFTYALFDLCVPAQPDIDRDEALQRLTRLYFRTRGPATASDFSWWSGLTMADVRRGIEVARADLEEVSVEGRTYWVSGDPPARTRPSVHLLPNYDEFFIGHRDRGALGRRLGSTATVTGGNALIANVIVIDGQLVGGWRRTLTGDGVTVTLKLLDTLSPGEERGLEKALARYGDFLGVPVRGEHVARRRSAD